MSASSLPVLGQRVRYTRPHSAMRDKPWIYLGEHADPYADAYMAIVIAPDKAPDPLPTVEDFVKMQYAVRAYYAGRGPLDESKHPARLAGKLWWFDILTVPAEDIKPAS